MIRRILTWASLGLLAVSVTACGGDDTEGGSAGQPGSTQASDPDGPTATSTTRVATSTTAPATTTTTPPYSFDGSVPPPDLLNTGTDYVAIFESLAGYRSWLVRHNPDPTLVAEAYTAGGAPFEVLRGDLELLRGGGQRLVEVGQRFEAAVVTVDRNIVTLRVREHITANQLVGPDGEVVEETPSGPVNDLVVMLVADSSGRWRIGDVVESTVDSQVQL